MDILDYIFKELEKRHNKKENTEVVEPPKTNCRNMLNAIVSESYDAGDVLIVPKRVIISIEEGIID